MGHINTSGGGARNPFGLDFASEGTTWTVSLCGMDSDGDGFTNGEELGDPGKAATAKREEERRRRSANNNTRSLN